MSRIGLMGAHGGMGDGYNSGGMTGYQDGVPLAGTPAMETPDFAMIYAFLGSMFDPVCSMINHMGEAFGRLEPQP